MDPPKFQMISRRTVTRSSGSGALVNTMCSWAWSTETSTRLGWLGPAVSLWLTTRWPCPPSRSPGLGGSRVREVARGQELEGITTSDNASTKARAPRQNKRKNKRRPAIANVTARTVTGPDLTKKNERLRKALERSQKSSVCVPKFLRRNMDDLTLEQAAERIKLFSQVVPHRMCAVSHSDLPVERDRSGRFVQDDTSRER